MRALHQKITQAMATAAAGYIRSREVDIRTAPLSDYTNERLIGHASLVDSSHGMTKIAADFLGALAYLAPSQTQLGSADTELAGVKTYNWDRDASEAGRNFVNTLALIQALRVILKDENSKTFSAAIETALRTCELSWTAESNGDGDEDGDDETHQLSLLSLIERLREDSISAEIMFLQCAMGWDIYLNPGAVAKVTQVAHHGLSYLNARRQGHSRGYARVIHGVNRDLGCYKQMTDRYAQLVEQQKHAAREAAQSVSVTDGVQELNIRNDGVKTTAWVALLNIGSFASGVARKAQSVVKNTQIVAKAGHLTLLQAVKLPFVLCNKRAADSDRTEESEANRDLRYSVCKAVEVHLPGINVLTAEQRADVSNGQETAQTLG